MNSALGLCLRVALGALALTAFDAALASDASAQRARPVPVTDGGRIDIDGQPEGPGTFYLVARIVPNYEAPVVRPSFVAKIVESVAREPF